MSTKKQAKRLAEAKFPPFKKARAFARTLGLENQTAFAAWRSALPRPRPLPSYPHRFYSAEWKGWKDFLGSSYKDPRRGKRSNWPSFRSVLRQIRPMNFPSSYAYEEFVRQQKTKRFPLTPRSVYASDWKGWDHFLGRKPEEKPPYWSFNKARSYAQSKRFKSSSEFYYFMRSAPADVLIPKEPVAHYGKQWKGWADFLGPTYNRQPYRRIKRSQKLTVIPGFLSSIPVGPLLKRGKAAGLTPKGR